MNGLHQALGVGAISEGVLQDGVEVLALEEELLRDFNAGLGEVAVEGGGFIAAAAEAGDIDDGDEDLLCPLPGFFPISIVVKREFEQHPPCVVEMFDDSLSLAGDLAFQKSDLIIHTWF